MKKFSTLILTLATLVFFVACKDEPDMPMQVITTDPESILVPYIGGNFTVEISSNTPWTYSCDELWITPSIWEYNGSTTLTLTVETNEGDERTATVTIESTSKDVAAEISVIQNGATATGFISISTLRALETSSAPVSFSGTGYQLRGFVITDASNGNYDTNTLAIADSFTEPNSGITLVVNGQYEDFEWGEEVYMPIDGGTLQRDDNGRLALYLDAANLESTGVSPVAVSPVEIEYSDLTDGSYESMYITTPRVQVLEAYIGGKCSDSPVFEDRNGNHLQMVVSKDATFADTEYAQGIGLLSGIAGPGTSVPFIQPLSASDLELTAARFSTGGIKSLPYAFSFLHSIQTDDNPKYVSHLPVAWDSSTGLCKGLLSEDLDESIGASLEICAYGAASSNMVNSTNVNMWAEIGGHDNFNQSGFVSMESKTIPPEECGWFLNVPLQMDLPENIVVTFGMGGNSWSMKYWHIYYSNDKITWYLGGNFTIDHIVSGGSYYMYHSVPISLSIPFQSKDTFYLKFVPYDHMAIGDGTDAYNWSDADGHGSSCYIRFHSCVYISTEKAGNTTVPSNAVYFEPFDNLVSGTDYFYGEKLAALANYCGNNINSWGSQNNLTGTNVMERPGYAQIGYVNTETPSSRTAYVNEVGELTTPAIGQSGDFTLSFKAAIYRSPAIRTGNESGASDVQHPDIDQIVVKVDGGGTVEGSTSYTVTNVPSTEFQTFTLSLKDVTADTKITFTSNPGSNEFSRWFIDDILITK